MTVSFSWNRPVTAIINDAVLRDGKTLKYMAVTWHRLYDRFVPMDAGVMAHDAVDYLVEGGEGIIHHKSPYAHYQYEGEKYVDPVTGAAGFLTAGGWFSRAGVAKVPSGEALLYDKSRHPLATKRWDEAAKAAGFGKELAKSLEAYLRAGGSE